MCHTRSPKKYNNAQQQQPPKSTNQQKQTSNNIKKHALSTKQKRQTCEIVFVCLCVECFCHWLAKNWKCVTRYRNKETHTQQTRTTLHHTTHFLEKKQRHNKDKQATIKHEQQTQTNKTKQKTLCLFVFCSFVFVLFNMRKQMCLTI